MPGKSVAFPKCMSIKGFYLSFILSLTLLTSNNLAHAQQTCAQVFTASAAAPANLKAAHVALERASQSLLFTIRNKPHTLDVATFEASMRQIEKLTEEYFNAAGIGFKKNGRLSAVKGLKDSGYYMALHQVYVLSGSAQGNEVARLLYGLQSHPDFKKHPAKVILDPLYAINNQDSYAHFTGSNYQIGIGSHVFMHNKLGIGADFRHEIQHYIEQVKIQKGEMSLARLELKNPDGKKEVAYSDYLKMDEIESHLRDLRYYTNTEKLAKIDAKNKMPEITESRADMVLESLERQQRFIRDSRKVLSVIKKSISNNYFLGRLEIINEKDSLKVKMELAKGPYPQATINLTGLLKPEDVQDSSKVKAAILNYFEWSEKRIAEVELELHRMESRL